MNKLSMCKLFLAAPNTYKDAVISNEQVRILELMSMSDIPTVDSRWLSDITGKSIQNASSILVRLWKKGYLTRTESVDPAGGIIYRYRRSFELRESADE